MNATGKNLLKAILRESAQPVAVVTSTLAPPLPHNKFHGATLSSFTSIAMDPLPVISFALRVPSRMATSLKHSYHSSGGGSGGDGHMVINILSAAQHHAALVFSRPDLYPHPFAHEPGALNDESLATVAALELEESSSLLHPSSPTPKPTPTPSTAFPSTPPTTTTRPPPPSQIPYHLSSAGLPILNNSLGAFTCRLLVPGLPLHDPTRLQRLLPLLNDVVDSDREGGSVGVGGVVSELFIAEVTKIELPWNEDIEFPGNLPLVYHRRGFTTCR